MSSVSSMVMGPHLQDILHQPCQLCLSGFGTCMRTCLVKVPQLADTGTEAGTDVGGGDRMPKFAYPLMMLMLTPLLLGQAAVPTAVPAQQPQTGSRTFMTGARLLELCKTENPYCT